MPSRLLLSTLCAAMIAAPAARAFNPEEHKLVGDLGSQRAAEAWKAILPASKLVRFEHKAGEVRLVTKSEIPAAKKFSGSFVPREAAHDAKSPMLVWVGSADRKLGEWFTLGDLVSLYGDFRRIITCDYDPRNNDCRLTDRPTASVGKPVAYDSAFLKRRYTAMKELSQGWNFWDGWGLAVSTSKASTILMTNNGVPHGANGEGDWADEFYKIAKGNHWHFGDTALKWYVAMHRQAFFLLSKAAAEKDPVKHDQLAWKALHYEGHALHSLTDLFAPGHVMVNRYVTTQEILAKNDQLAKDFPAWQARIWATTFTNGGPTGTLLPHPAFDAVAKVENNELEMLTHASAVTFKAKYEGGFHDKFNASGAVVKNLKRGGAGGASLFVSKRPRADLPAEWRVFGDGKLYSYGGKSRSNPGQGEWVEAAVEDSLLSLADAYEAVVKGSDPAAISTSALLFDALGDLPVEMRNACVDKERCFAPDKGGKGAGFRYVSYAPTAMALTGSNAALAAANRLPDCTGASAKSGPSSNWKQEGCEQAWDGASSLLESTKAGVVTAARELHEAAVDKVIEAEGALDPAGKKRGQVDFALIKLSAILKANQLLLDKGKAANCAAVAKWVAERSPPERDAAIGHWAVVRHCLAAKK